MSAEPGSRVTASPALFNRQPGFSSEVRAGGAASATTRFQPLPLHDPETFSSYQTERIEDITVSVAVLTDEEAERHFGADLGAYGVQALWVRVHNASPSRYWFIRNIVDRDLYSADEAAQLVGEQVPDRDFEALRQHFRDQSIRVRLEPGYITEGHLYLPV